MCTVCGLPTTHATATQVVGFLALFFFLLSTFLGAWLVLAKVRWQQRYNEVAKPTPLTEEEK